MNCDWRCQVRNTVFDVIFSAVRNNPHLNKDAKYEFQNKRTKYLGEDVIYEYIKNDWVVAEDTWNEGSASVIVEEGQPTTIKHFYKESQKDKLESKINIKTDVNFQLFETKASVNFTFGQTWEHING